MSPIRSAALGGPVPVRGSIDRFAGRKAPRDQVSLQPNEILNGAATSAQSLFFFIFVFEYHWRLRSYALQTPSRLYPEGKLELDIAIPKATG